MRKPRRRCRRRQSVHRPNSCGNSVTKRIAGIKYEIRVRRHKRGAFDDGDEIPVADSNLSFKNASDNALLTPRFSGLQLAIGVKASELRAGSGAARRAVVSLARAQ